MTVGMTILEATREWVKEMDAYPYEMIERLVMADPDDWHEVTAPCCGDRVYVYEEDSRGTIERVREPSDDDEIDEVLYEVKLDNNMAVFARRDDMEVERDSFLPMWGAMWSFRDSADDYWLEELDGIRLMSECDFRIYESETFGHFFGIDGAGYDFYEAHWVPLYKARGLQWHDPATESGSFVMTEWRKADLYEGLLDYLSESISSSEELVNVLKGIGFRDEEIAFEGLEVIGDDEDGE